MRFKRPSGSRDGEPTLIPLINVVFLLLVFFMLAGRLDPGERAALEPPRSDSAGDARPATLLVVIDRWGQVSLNGEPLDDLSLAARVADAVGDRHRLQIRADARLKARRLIELLDRLSAAGAEELDLLTLGRRQ